MKILFNASTNTCFSCGMSNKDIKNSDTSSSTTTVSEGIGLGPDHLDPTSSSTTTVSEGPDHLDPTSSSTNSSSTTTVSEGIGLDPDHLDHTRSENNAVGTENNALATENLDPSRSENSGVGILAGIDYESLSELFKDHTKYKKMRFQQDKKLVVLTLRELSDKERFTHRLREILLSRCVVYVKVVYSPNLFRMVGSQIIFSTYSRDGINDLWNYTLEGIKSQLDQYGFTLDRVNHIMITIVPVKLNLVSKYKVKRYNDKNTEDIRNFIDTNFTSKTIIPVTVNPAFLGGELLKTVINGKIVDVYYYLPSKDKVPITKVSLEHSFLLNNKLSSLSPEFKFYNVILNSRSYILGIHYLSSNSVRKIRLSLSGLLLEDIVDTVLLGGKVKRVNNNNVIVMKDYKVIDHYKVVKFLAINSYKNKNVSYTENPNIGVLDFETFQSDDGTYKIYAGGFKTYLDDEVTMYYVEDVKHPELSVLKLINELLRSKYSKTTFYCHNLGGFDVIFLIKILVDYNENNSDKYELSFKFRENLILALTISKGGNKLTIKDSYAILNSSLRDLAKSYACNFNKSYFPYKFSTQNNLFYLGITPTKSYYEGISQAEYDKLYSENWSFKEETLKYLELDLETLYEVLSKANKQLFLEYDIDMTKSYTISGLALKLYLAKYYKNNIPNINKKSIYTELKLGYYGGITEVYIPYGKNLFYYDINSLYPYASLNDMPGLSAKNVLITNRKDIAFGFFYCLIDATEVQQEYLGLLPLRTKSNGLTFPLGKWSGWYFSEELKFAKSHGYKITVIKGYEFNREVNMFNNYIKDIYSHKVNATNPVQKAIAKSLLNNLLGRFGINLDKYETDLVNDYTFNNISMIRDVKGYTNIGDMRLVSYSSSINYDNVNKLGLDVNEVLKHNKDSEMTAQSASSVVISAAVTAYARIIMSKHKLEILNAGGKIYYSDTDSIVTDTELSSDLVSSSELGKFKLEYKVKEGIFISGQTYLLVLEDGSIVKRAKGVKPDSLSYDDYINLLNNRNTSVTKKSSIKDYSKGSVDITTVNVMLNADAYAKRTKLYDGNIWINTKPIYINEIDKSLIIYKEPILSLVVRDIINPFFKSSFIGRKKY